MAPFMASLPAVAERWSLVGRVYLDSCIDAISATAAGASFGAGSLAFGGTACLGTDGVRDAGVLARRVPVGRVCGAVVGRLDRGVRTGGTT